MTVVVDFGVNCAVLAVKDAVVASHRVSFKYRWMASLIRCDAPFEVTAPVTLVDCDVGALLLIDEVSNLVAVAVADEATGVAALLEADVLTDETDADAVDETKVVADGATLVGTVLGCIEVCVVCLHSKEHEAPANI